MDDLHEGGELWRSILPSDGDDHGDRRRKHSARARQTIVAMNAIGEEKPEHITKARAESFLHQSLLALQEDPVLMGMSPLFKDYESDYWWFEVPKFVSTLMLCGLVTLLPASGASQVFVSLVVSIGMFGLFANCKPYLSKSDDLLAQFCQISLTFAMAVGILEMASESFQVCIFVLTFVCVFSVIDSSHFVSSHVSLLPHCGFKTKPKTTGCCFRSVADHKYVCELGGRDRLHCLGLCCDGISQSNCQGAGHGFEFPEDRCVPSSGSRGH